MRNDGFLMIEDQKRRQVEYHEREHYRACEPRMADNSHRYVEWLNNYRLATATQMMRVPLSGKTLLSVCGGDGQEADYFQRQGAKVTVIDLSAIALEAARLRNPDLQCACMDAESLTFADRSFDWVLVRDGLHHLARPIKGFYELERVAREGFVILEGQDSLPVRFLSRLGIAENWDPAGGYVYRFSRREMRKVFSSMQTVSDWKMYTAWLPFGSDVLSHFPPFRRLVYPAMTQPLISRFLGTKAARSACKTLFQWATSVAGYWGNSLIVVAHKK
jgi:ubiquinone/menaquinone biosynthesis C-methylase UbiE